MSSRSAVDDQSNFRITRSNSRLKKRRYSFEINLSDDDDWKSSPRLKARKLATEHDEGNCSQETKQIVKKPEEVLKKEKMFFLPKDWCITRLSTFEFTYKWTVENFSLLRCKTGEALSSAIFKIPQVPSLECNLLLYPNGHDEKCKNNACATLQCLTEDGLDMNCELMILNISGNKVTSTYKTQPCNIKKLSNSKTTYCVMTKSKLISLLKNDVLVILCILSINESTQKTSADNQYNAVEVQNQSEVLSDLYAFIKEKDFCDVILCIDNQEFYAHRSVLAARSSLFRKMFEHFTDKGIRKFTIDKIQPLIFKEILSFIYTGKILDIESSTSDLLEAACKFDLLELKTMCERHLIENLSLDNVLQNLVLADNRAAVDLKEKAKNFIVAYSGQIVESPGFKLVRNLSFNLYQEILCLILNDDNV